jgi:SnoaL-like domain
MSSVRLVIDDELVAEAVHDTGVRRLQHAYADVVNRRAWPELSDLFEPDAPVIIDRRSGEPLRLTGPAALGEFIGASIEQFEFFEFVVLNAHIVFPEGPGAGTAVSRLFMCEIRHHRDTGRQTNAYGIYHDRYRFDSRRWWFAERRYHSLARHGRELDTFPFPEQPGVEVPRIGH